MRQDGKSSKPARRAEPLGQAFAIASAVPGGVLCGISAERSEFTGGYTRALNFRRGPWFTTGVRGARMVVARLAVRVRLTVTRGRAIGYTHVPR
ncbi:hypothetical protein chiPu_0028787, partial [Chiloscyllium punctatum]|nr:hypothetical protein [Chiloscyllium punctatum]